ncbi:RHS repeat-associated protein [Flavobacterium chryseum]|uniref:RHS repeat-associated core domain-containing protein n=1 Tax=Flavobacterium circumlabens TaxID=2133765 RepID=A0A4Y7U8H2_9FLAO|nr:RHS repeat-associated core domain-containing protein [Flavobacterium circumlabens]TCN53840.1 RHS repeat-associated protein [Flavobacterium circumlabens]TDO84186.1 RHS repeat-associated protein [Flavobacterium sp. P3160]TEB42564.1 RHS repeat-associated core domain-containing protein [Flavobacterium circumlabens]
MLVPNRHESSKEYRYGFNGKEKDDEIKGGGLQYDYGFRVYDPRIGKFLSQDPLTKDYPFYSPYQFAGNSPIMAIDLDGLEMKISTTVSSSEKINSTSSKITMVFNTDIHFKVLNATGVKVEGFEKVIEQAQLNIMKTYSDLTGTGTQLGLTNFKGKKVNVNKGGIFYNYTVTSKVKTSYEMITSLGQIKANDYVIILGDDRLKAVTYKGTNINPPAYTDLEGQVMILDIKNLGAKLNSNGRYDFNGGGEAVRRISNVINHELGHQFSLEDQYTGTGIPNKGFEKNTMGNSNYKSINFGQKNQFLAFLFRFADKYNIDNTYHSSESAKTSTTAKLSSNSIATPKL